LELWDNTSLTANELHGVLEATSAPTRFVFTQCYSGGFHRLAYKNPSSGLELSDELRCGFTSESAYRIAEGCSASINTDDYRDYTTFFFAALDGYDRTGEILGVETDTDNDGSVSLREAHLYTLEHAHSTDLSRSTSEDYLLNWQPWFLKWIAGSIQMPNNEYAKLFRSLADKHGISLDTNAAKQIRDKIKGYEKVTMDLTDQREQLYIELSDHQYELEKKVIDKWPALSGPYTAAFQSLAMSGEIANVANWIKEQPQYPKIVQLQNEDDALNDAFLDNERNLTQMQKMLHLRKLALIKQQVYKFGTDQNISDYEKKRESCSEANRNCIGNTKVYL